MFIPSVYQSSISTADEKSVKNQFEFQAFFDRELTPITEKDTIEIGQKVYMGIKNDKWADYDKYMDRVLIYIIPRLHDYIEN